LEAIEVTIDVNLKKRCRMVGGSTGALRFNSTEAKRVQLKLVDKGVNDSDWVVLGDVVLETLRQ
jgi:hypothetical protein